MIDIFNPPVSEVVGGLEGKIILIYGTNRTGKTLNAVKSKKPFVVGFERGLNAIPGIPFSPILTWRDWTDTVKQLTGPQKDRAKEMYNTIIVDTIDAMGDLASDYICQLKGINSIAEGNHGFGAWKDYAAEISKWIRTLTNSGYTVIFLGHEGTREQKDEKGVKYDKIYPRGEKRVVDPIADLADIICYAQPQPINDKGDSVNSTLYLVGTNSFHAGSRFKYIVPTIVEWDMDKLEKAITDAVAEEEKHSKVKSISASDADKKVADAAKSKWADRTTAELVQMCVEKGGATIEKTGSPEFYQDILFREFNTRDFKVSNAGEQQRPQVEQLLDALIAAGY